MSEQAIRTQSYFPERSHSCVEHMAILPGLQNRFHVRDGLSGVIEFVLKLQGNGEGNTHPERRVQETHAELAGSSLCEGKGRETVYWRTLAKIPPSRP